MTRNVVNFAEIVRDVSGGNPKLPQSSFLSSGSLPVVDQGQAFIAGYTDDEAYSFRSSELPVVVFGDHTKAIKYVDFPFAMGADGVKVLKPSPECDTKYLYHFLRQVRLPDAGYSRHFKFLKEVSVPLPSISEQRRIAAILDKADALRAKRRESIAKLDQLLQSVFLDMFGDPVTNPKGWPIDRLGNYCDVRDGTHDSPKYVDQGFPLVTSKNLVSGRVDLEGAMKISAADYDQINRRSKVDRGDLLMPMIGTIGNPVLVDHDPSYAIKNVALLKFGSAIMRNVYVLQLLRSNYFEWATAHKNRGGTQKFLALGDIRNLPVPVPPHDLQTTFSSYFEVIGAKALAMGSALKQTENFFEAVQNAAFASEANAL